MSDRGPRVRDGGVGAITRTNIARLFGSDAIRRVRPLSRSVDGMTPHKLYSTVALAETITWALLLGSMALKYSGITEATMPIAGGLHGFTFLSFCVATMLIWVNNRWSVGHGIIGLASSIIPFATIPWERHAENKNLLQQQWRFGAGSTEEPNTFPDKVLALVLTKPLLALVIAIVVISVVFVILLSLGSPAEWF